MPENQPEKELPVPISVADRLIAANEAQSRIGLGHPGSLNEFIQAGANGKVPAAAPPGFSFDKLIGAATTRANRGLSGNTNVGIQSTAGLGHPGSAGGYDSVQAAVAAAMSEKGDQSLPEAFNPLGPAGPTAASAVPLPASNRPGLDDYLSPYQDSLTSFNEEEATILSGLAEQYGVARDAQAAQNAAGAGEIGAAADAASTSISGIQGLADARQEALRAASSAATSSINDARLGQFGSLLAAVGAGGGDVGQIAGELGSSAGRVAREQSAAANHLVGLQELGQSSLASILASGELIEQSSMSKLANNFSAAQSALDAAELQSTLDVQTQFAESRRKLEFDMAQVALRFQESEADRADALAKEARGRAGSGPSSAKSDAASYLGNAFGIDPNLILAGDEFGYADNVLKDGTTPAPDINDPNAAYFNIGYQSGGGYVPALDPESPLFETDAVRNTAIETGVAQGASERQEQGQKTSNKGGATGPHAKYINSLR